MKLAINLEYYTRWGESLFIEFAQCEPMAMIPLDDRHWHITVDNPAITPGHEYTFSLRTDDGKVLRREWRGHTVPRVSPDLAMLDIADTWRDRPAHRAFLTTPFLDCICRRDSRLAPAAPISAGSVSISVDAPLVDSHLSLAICGSIPELGSWDPAKAVILSDADYPTWRATIPIDLSVTGFDYKLLLVDRRTRELHSWEPRDNRTIHLGKRSSDAAVAVSGISLALPHDPWRGAGVSIPVFSLRSDSDWGVGDFLDMIPLADWAEKTGQRFIQLLPINDTTMTGTWADSYPYNANSTFALHPMYLRPDAVGTLPDDRMAYYNERRRSLQLLPEVDYEQTNALKNEYMRELFNLISTDLVADPEFNSFIQRNSSWLTPYAAYCVLRDKYGTPEPSNWGAYAIYDPQRIAAFVDENFKEISFVYFIQFHLDRQLRTARDYAHAHGIAIKGDIPIGISRTSVDAWKQPELFNLDASAGAPPDDFSILGQNWGFPTYNWDAMSRDGFAWWKARFRKMSEYFDAYRIDHVLGFFRIWQIPLDQLHGLLGAFNAALPFSPQELRDNYNFQPDPADYSKPYIADWMLADFFGDLTGKVRDTYLIPHDNGRYSLKPEVACQRRIADLFATMEKNDDNTRICNGLLGLCDQVLFIEDPYRKGMYHPRIGGGDTYAYRSLCDYDKYLFGRIHNDFFYRRNDMFWRDQAMWKLPPVIEATDMLTCAEDLGMIPACVPDVLHHLQILSLEIQRMPKDPHDEFGNPARYPYMSVCTTSTHDMPGIRQWWELDHATTQKYYNNVLHCSGEAPYFAEPWICSLIVGQHLASPSMLCILPLQDWLSTDATLRRQDPREEQINIPAISRHYWRYRMHLTLEQLNEASGFNHAIRGMITDSGRLM